MTGTCPFCTLSAGRIVLANELAVVIRDDFPVSPGAYAHHPKLHVVSLFDVTGDEREAMLALLDSAKLGLDAAFHPDGYNVGIDDGEAAGQTVPQLHLHLIPRYAGDREDPRGGVRWILPQKAKYWP
jgi:diadenosine tetraphosphate (Ap4A) HIT family hydrolase